MFEFKSDNSFRAQLPAIPAIMRLFIEYLKCVHRQLRTLNLMIALNYLQSFFFFEYALNEKLDFPDYLLGQCPKTLDYDIKYSLASVEIVSVLLSRKQLSSFSFHEFRHKLNRITLIGGLNRRKSKSPSMDKLSLTCDVQFKTSILYP